MLVSERYRAQMLEAVNVHLRKWQRRPLEEITTEVMEEARRTYLATEGRKTLKGVEIKVPHTVGGFNRVVRLVSALFGWAVKKRKYLPTRPWHLTERKVQQVPRSDLWPEQVRGFLNAVRTHTHSRIIRLSVEIQIGLGLRETETASARWEWLSWRQGLYSPGATKNRRTRHIPILDWLAADLREEWERQGKPSRGLILPYGTDGTQVY